MKAGFYSHPGKRANPEGHGTVARYEAGCRCWRCQNGMKKAWKAARIEKDLISAREIP